MRPQSLPGPGFKRGHVFRGKKTHLQRAPSYLPDPRLVGSLVPFPKCHSMHLKTRHKVASGLQEPRGFALRTAQKMRRRGPLGCSFPEGGEGGRFSDYHGASMSVGTKPLGMYLGKNLHPISVRAPSHLATIPSLAWSDPRRVPRFCSRKFLKT